MLAIDPTPAICGASPAATDNIVLLQAPVRKPDNDKRLYRSLVLPNQMRVMLVSDPTATKAAAAISVGVGFNQDPDAIPGLAHFCEHMLYRGTKKYPDEQGYPAFLSSHGGHYSGTTNNELTTYVQDMSPEHLEEALDRLAQFFIAPMFNQDAMEREMQAVHSEHSNYLQDDERRVFQMLATSANANHPVSRFGVGNLTSLKEMPAERGIDVRQALLDFHSQYYSANLMTLAVLSRESLDRLQELVVNGFQEVVNKNVPVPRQELIERAVPAYRPEDLGKISCIVPIADLRELRVIFALPPQDKHWRTNPVIYLGHLICHMLEGSLQPFLLQKGWAQSVNLEKARIASDHNLFRLTFSLTRAGVDHVNDIVGHLFEYIGMLNKVGPQEWVFTEIQTLFDLEFRFMNTLSPFDFVSMLAQELHSFPSEDLLCAGRTLEKFDADLIGQTLQLLNPSNLLLQVIAPEFAGKTDQTEPWYGIQHKCAPIDPQLLHQWTQLAEATTAVNPEFRLPPQNDFLPSSLRLKPLPASSQGAEYPMRIVEEAGMTVWFKQTNAYGVPKAEMLVEIVSLSTFDSPRHVILNQIWSLVVMEALKNHAFFAAFGGLSISLTATDKGLLIHIQGYDEKIPVLLEQVLTVMHSMRYFQLQQEQFDNLKAMVMSNTRNAAALQPFELALKDVDLLEVHQRWPIQDYLQAITSLTKEELEMFGLLMLQDVSLSVLIVGNVTAQEALSWAQSVPAKLQSRPLAAALLPELRMVRLKSGHRYVYRRSVSNPQDCNSALCLYFQFGQYDSINGAYCALLEMILHSAAFDELRTKQQLGYVVATHARDKNGICGLQFVIQSPHKDPVFLEDRIEEFLATTARKLIHEMPPSELESFRQSLLSKLQVKPHTLNQEVTRYRDEIRAGTLQFDRTERQANVVASMSHESLCRFFDERLSKGGSQRRVLSVQVFGGQHTLPTEEREEAMASEETVVVDIVKLHGTAVGFKQSMPLYASCCCGH